MIKNKKIVALICALSMIFTLFTSFTVVKADVATGTLVIDNVQNDGEAVTFDISYTGFTDGISGLTIYMQMPDSVTSVEKVSTTISSPVATVGFNAETKIASYVWTAAVPEDENASPNVQYTDGKIATLKAKTGSAIKTDNQTITIVDNGLQKTSVGYYDAANETNVSVKKENLGNLTTSIPKWTDPNAKDTTEETRAATDAVDEVDPNKPVLNPEVTVGDFGLIIDNVKLADDGGSATFDLSYKGYADGISGLTIYMQMPSNATNVEKVSTTISSPVATVGFNAQTKIASYVWTAAVPEDENASPNVQYTDGKIATLKVTLDPTTIYDTQIQVVDNGLQKTSVGYYDAANETNVSTKLGTTEGTINAVNATIPGYVPAGKGEIDVDNIIKLDKDITDTPDTTTGISDYFIKLDVQKDKEDGTDGTEAAEYGIGKDYTLVYTDKTGTEHELTKAQATNLLEGRFNAANIADLGVTSMQDVVNNTSVKKYNSSVKAKGMLVEAATSEIQNSNYNTYVDETSGGDDPSDNPLNPTASISIKQSPSGNVAPGKEVTVTATATEKDGAQVKTLTVTVPTSSFAYVNSDNFVVTYGEEVKTLTKTDNTVTFDIDEDGVLSVDVKFTTVNSESSSKKITIDFTGTYDDDEDIDKKTSTTTVTGVKSTSGGSGSGSSSKDKDNTSSGGGAIATGLVDSGSGYLPSLGFDDLGDVEWAQNAINTLAAKKIVSGVGDNKFDPNAALTRAAYAQMLVNAIGHSQDSADVEFDDVPTDAWFYHNVAVAAQLGIVAGFGDGTFRPYDLITREQMALMTQKAAVVMGKSLVGADAGTFTDDADIADWSRDAVYQLSNAGIINGMGDGSFAPQANATRAQAAVIIYQAFVK